jgi:hypothetical protein
MHLPINNPDDFEDIADDEDAVYKGLNTSVSHIFRNPDKSRVDCCSIACCGILQSDYNRYILTGIKPPSFKTRLSNHILLPISIFIVAGYCAVTIRDVNLNQLVSTALVVFIIGYITYGCMRSSYKRSLVRKELLRRVQYLQEGVSPLLETDAEQQTDEDVGDLLLQSSYEMTCVHRSCSCYKNDYPSFQTLSEDVGSTNEDFLSVLSRYFAKSCCGVLCNCFCQCCGTCALAQEGRQIEAIVPLSKRRMDYVTFEFFVDYVNPIRRLRDQQDGKLWKHYVALSKLSRMLLKTLFSTIAILLVFTLVFSPSSFQLSNLVVFLATFCQAFFILYFVHWQWHRFDISLDAVIKYFACGFILSTSTAIIFELISSVLLQIIFGVIMFLCDVDVVVNNDDNQNYNNYQQFSSFSKYFSSFPNSFANNYSASFESQEDYKKAFQKQYPFIVILYLFLNAYVVAALIEELCKYFGFKMVEHPDFLSDTELEASATAVAGMPDMNADSYDTETDDEGCLGFGCGVATERTRLSGFMGSIGDSSTHREELYPAEPRSSRSIGSGITIAMVSVGLGFACCENLIYIFLYSGTNLWTEIAVLVSRSLFPVHPLCAAIQSIGVCEQKLEKNRSIGLGKIIFPAFMLHGTYDFAIMLLNFISTVLGDDNEDVVLTCSLLALATSTVSIIGGWLYFKRQGRYQNERLDSIDSATNFVGVAA